jgi:hypothetical protein
MFVHEPDVREGGGNTLANWKCQYRKHKARFQTS